MEYQGDADAICPISLKTVIEINVPVAFREMPRQPYECTDLMTWLRKRPVNPTTNVYVEWM